MNKIKLGEICEVSKGSQLNKIDMMNSGKYYVQNGGIDISGYTDNYNTDENTISISEGGNSCGYVNFNNEKFWAGGHCYRLLNLRNDVDVKYLYQLLKYKQRDIMKLRVGSGLPNIQKKDIKKLEIYLPELKSQRKISILLDLIDKIIKNYELLMKEKEQFVKSQFVEMFGNIITNDKKWDLMQWKQVVIMKNGKSQKGVEDNNGRYPIYGSGGIIGYANDYICNENTIIIGRKGNINKPFVVYEKFWNVDTAFGIEPIFNKISLSYLYMFCLIYNFNKLNQASTIPSLTKNDLLNIKIPVPPIIIQNQFEQIVKLIDKQKFNYINKIKLLNEIINIFLGGKKI